MKTMPNDPSMLKEYDFSKGVKGKYSSRYKEGSNVVVIDPDIVEYFPDHDSVNEALRLLTTIMKKQKYKLTEQKTSADDISAREK